jgi:uncharacterized protein (TIGR02594 family)
MAAMSTAFNIAYRLIGQTERPGPATHPMIAWAYELCGLPGFSDDDQAWCGAFQMLLATLAGEEFPNKPARARSWLTVGDHIHLAQALPGDIVVFTRAGATHDATVIDAPGHVGRLSHFDYAADTIEVLGGNQGNRVSILPYREEHLLGIRRLKIIN